MFMAYVLSTTNVARPLPAVFRAGVHDIPIEHEQEGVDKALR